ncbi:MAG: hypothetical protein ACYDCK_13260 [Thermoplasmatota archaeon]
MTLATVYDALPLVALGAFPVLIAGTSRLLVAGLLGRRVALAAPFSLLPGAFMTVGAVAAAAHASTALVALWSLGAAFHLAVMLVTFGRPRGLRALRGRRLDRAAMRMLDAASLAYLAATAVAAPLATARRVAIPVVAHLALAGFVTLTIVTVATHILPRFTGAAFPPRVLATFTPLVATGPALLAAGVTGDARVFAAGAALEATGLALFAVNVLVMLARSSRPRAAFAGYVLACVSILAGVGLGVLFAFDPPTRAFAPAHGVANAFGFVGGFVFGAAADLYAPAVRRGSRALAVQTLVATTTLALGVATTFAAILAGSPGLARAGMALVALAGCLLFAGAVATVARAHRLARSAGSLGAPRIR